MIKVKPLKWDVCGKRTQLTVSPIGLWSITHTERRNLYRVYEPIQHSVQYFATLDEARNYAQAKFEQIINDCLIKE